MKGVILSLNPHAIIIDITHEIPPQDIEAAAFALLAVYNSFPTQTINVAVVDPGVGSSRRAILIAAAGRFFLGPDNGLFSYICEREKDHKVFNVTNEKYFQHPVSATFHGRDVFAPVAAALSRGVKPNEFGPKINDYVRLKTLNPVHEGKGILSGRIIHVDHFGNCITNFTCAELTPSMIAAGSKLRVNGKKVKSFKNFFGEETGDKEKVFALWGSAGFLEIAARNDSAAKLLKATRGDAVIVKK